MERRAELNIFRPGGDKPDHRFGFAVMSSPEQATRPASDNSPARRIAAAVILSGLVFMLLWMMVFGMITSALISTGCCVVVIAASSVSDIVEMLLDAVASAVFGILAVIAAIFGVIFSLFGL